MRLHQLRDIRLRGVLRAGCEMRLSDPPTKGELATLSSWTTFYLQRTARKVYRDVYFGSTEAVPRFFFAAVLSSDAVDDHGCVDFFLTPRELRDRVVAGHFTRVAVELMDGDNPVPGLVAFLRPHFLDAAHQWGVPLEEAMGTALTERWAHRYRMRARDAATQLRTHIFAAALGTRVLPPGESIWCRE